jgi:hypothetical protein
MHHKNRHVLLNYFISFFNKKCENIIEKDMSVFLLHFRTAWKDHFTATTTTNLSQQTYTSRQSPSGSNVYVSNCLFKSISSTSNGGALSVTSVTYFLVESTSFFSCRTSSGYGGAIYFSYSSDQSVLHNVCGYDCLSTYTSGPLRVRIISIIHQYHVV